MATIIEFRTDGGRVIHKPPPGGQCELILFPGVRYESLNAKKPAATATPDAKRKVSARKRKSH